MTISLRESANMCHFRRDLQNTKSAAFGGRACDLCPSNPTMGPPLESAGGFCRQTS